MTEQIKTYFENLRENAENDAKKLSRGTLEAYWTYEFNLSHNSSEFECNELPWTTDMLRNYIIFFIFTTTPAVYGVSQARGLIRALPVAYATATLGLSHICKLHRSLRILNPLSEARDRTHVLIGTMSHP